MKRIFLTTLCDYIKNIPEYWDIVKNDIYPEGPYVYISPATSFLKGRVPGHWYRGKEVLSVSF